MQALRVPFFLDYDDGLGGRFANSPGLLPLLSNVRRQGFDVPFVDDVEELLRCAAAPDTDAVAFSSMERLLPRTIEIAQRVRALRPDLPLVLGGNSIKPFAPDLAAGLFDIVVVGEGEHVFPALLQQLARALGRRTMAHEPASRWTVPARLVEIGRSAARGALKTLAVQALMSASFQRRPVGQGGDVAIGVGGVFVRDGQTGQLWRLDEPTREDWVETWGQAPGDPDAAPELALGSAPLGEELDGLFDYPWQEWERHSWATMEFYTQRGCRWGRCEFCSVGRRDVRSLSIDTVVATLVEAARRGVQMVSFSDDLFVQHSDWNRDLLQRIASLELGIGLRAQTMANRAVWPLLPLMRRAGFEELSFGVETLDPARARFMVKSYNGDRYVDGALETIARVAQSGIRPVLYMIMADPTSRLIGIARELNAILEAMERIYERTQVLPKLSYTLTLLPLAGTVATDRLGYTVREVALDDRVLKFPNEFRFDNEVARYLQLAAGTTSALPYRRENLGAFPHYLESARVAARDCQSPSLAQVEAIVDRGLSTYACLAALLDRDVQDTADQLLQGVGLGSDPRHFEFSRFGGYIHGVQRYLELLDAGAAA